MTEEKETVKKEVQKEKEAQKEVDPKLLELIEIMKTIRKEMSDAEKEERITVFLEYMREKKNGYSTEKQSLNNENPVDIGSLLKTLSFKKSKSGKSEFAPIDPKIAQNIPQEFETKEDKFFVKKDSNNKTAVIIKVKKKQSQ